MSEENTGKTVYFTYDSTNPPQLTPEQRERLDSIKDEDIDCSDIPEQKGLDKWSRPGLLGGHVGELRRAAMREKLLYLDDRVVEFFNSGGDDAPARMNAVLLDYVESHRKRA